jgi:hypothetical protein
MPVMEFLIACNSDMDKRKKAINANLKRTTLFAIIKLFHESKVFWVES